MVMIQMQVWGSRVHITAIDSGLQRSVEGEGRQQKCPVETSGEGHRAALEELCQLTRPGNEEWMGGGARALRCTEASGGLD